MDDVLNAVLFGRWDEALRRAEEQIALGPHYSLDSLLYLKAYMLAARDQLGPLEHAATRRWR